jgi:hypothetical protein
MGRLFRDCWRFGRSLRRLRWWLRGGHGSHCGSLRKCQRTAKFGLWHFWWPNARIASPAPVWRLVRRRIFGPSRQAADGQCDNDADGLHRRRFAHDWSSAKRPSGWTCHGQLAFNLAMGFNKRRLESERAAKAAREAEARRALGPQIAEDAEHLVADWNERRAKHMPMLFSPTIGAAVAARHWFLWVRCPACRTVSAIDLRRLDWHCDAAVIVLIPALSCGSCRPNAPFAELIRISRTSVADEFYVERTRGVFGE